MAPQSPTNLPGRVHLPHENPLWVDSDASTYFITICCQEREQNQLCVPEVADALLASARFYREQGKWHARLFLLMPDHVHLLGSFPRERRLRDVITAWKRYTARQHGIVWQRDFFEHRLRSDESEAEKGDYILQNPVRAGLSSSPDEWPYLLRFDT